MLFSVSSLRCQLKPWYDKLMKGKSWSRIAALVGFGTGSNELLLNPSIVRNSYRAFVAVSLLLSSLIMKAGTFIKALALPPLPLHLLPPLFSPR